MGGVRNASSFGGSFCDSPTSPAPSPGPPSPWLIPSPRPAPESIGASLHARETMVPVPALGTQGPARSARVGPAPHTRAGLAGWRWWRRPQVGQGRSGGWGVRAGEGMHRVEDAEVVAPEEEDAVLARELEEALHAPQRVGVGQQLAYVRNDGVHVGLQPRLELVRLDVDCAAARGGRGRRRAAVGARHTVTASPPRSQPGRRYLGWGRLRARKIAAREVHENCPSIARKFQRRNFPRHCAGSAQNTDPLAVRCTLHPACGWCGRVRA